MIVDLVQVTTRDGVRLDGILQVPTPGSTNQLDVDCCMFVHGTGGSFYSSALFDPFAVRFVEVGCAALRINTRGHDLMSTAATAQGGRRIGAAYEVVDECRHDLAAWIDWLARLGYSRIGLIGHSLGAVKAIYTLGQESHKLVARLVAVSPPRLSYSHFRSSERAAEFLDAYETAQRHVEQGESSTLMEVQVPLPFVVTAGGYVEKYGPDERYNFLKLVDQLQIPTLFTFGTAELGSNMAFRGLPDLLAPITSAHPHIQVAVIPGADHFYSRQRPALVAATEQWLRKS
jgi:pimeloyl-ACP methyl ester carboxylesterase